MSMDAADWHRMASVFRAGAGRAHGWANNSAMHQHAEILDTQADRCEEIARELDGNPPVTHDHYHDHVLPDGSQVLHRHPHEHAAGETGHDIHGYQPPRWPH